MLEDYLRLFKKLESKLPELKTIHGPLTEVEKRQLLAATRQQAPLPPKLAALSARDFEAFATAASQFQGVPKSVRFVGNNWKL